MENTRGLYAVMSMKNTPVPKDSSYWKDRKDIIYHLDRYNRQVEWLAKDLGAKIIYGDDYINANVVWRESGEPANQIEKLIDGGVISTTEFHGRVHGKFKLCDETMSSIDTELRNSYRKYRLLKNCLKENSEEPIASIVTMGKEVGDKANEFFDKYSEYLALDDIKRWYSDCASFYGSYDRYAYGNENTTLKTTKEGVEVYRDGVLLDKTESSGSLYLYRQLHDKIRFRDPLREDIITRLIYLAVGRDAIRKASGDKSKYVYLSDEKEKYKLGEILEIILDDPVICIKSEEEVTRQPLVKVREIRKNLSLFQRLYRKVLG